VRQVLLIGEDPKKYIEDYSKEFLSNFLNLLKTSHGEKQVHINQFYQQIIADKEVSFGLWFLYQRRYGGLGLTVGISFSTFT
jgi:hypothetical protein